MRNTKVILIIVAIIASSCLSGNLWAGDHGHKAPKKIGILLVAFGSSIPSARVSFENIDRQTREKYAGIDVR